MHTGDPGLSMAPSPNGTLSISISCGGILPEQFRRLLAGQTVTIMLKGPITEVQDGSYGSFNMDATAHELIEVHGDGTNMELRNAYEKAVSDPIRSMGTMA